MIRIEDKAKCCGCGACASRCPKGCIRMVPDEEGFLYPRVDTTSCIDCGRCEDVCPEQEHSAPRRPLQTLAAVCEDEALRLQSSSGGIFSLLAQAVLARGGVVFGARFDESWQVVIDHTETLEGLAAFRGSKYVQAAMGRAYADCAAFLKAGREVLFTGTPCQIAGLKAFLGCDYPRLTLVDVACVGVPSPGVWQDYLRSEVLKSAEDSTDGFPACVQEICFRDKSQGWKDSRFVLKTKGGGEQSMPRYKNPFFQALNTGLITRPGCYSCQLKSQGRSGSDLTLADCWGVEQLVPSSHLNDSRFQDDKGVSLVVVRSEKGASLLKDLPLVGLECNYEKALALNAGLRAGPHAAPHAGPRAGAPSKAREAFFHAYQADKTQVGSLLKKAVMPPLYQKILNKLRSL